MALTITATPVPSAYAVDLSVAGAAGVPFTITAEPYGRDPYTVRAIGTPTADPSLVRDHSAPLRCAIRYTVIAGASSASVYLDAPGLDVGGVVLSSTSTPGSSIPVRVLTDNPHEWEARSAWFDVIGRRDPLVSVDVMRFRSGEWQLYAVDQDARAALLRVLTPGAPVLLRSSDPTVVDDTIALPQRVTESPHVDEYGGRVFTITYQAVTRTLGPYPGTAAWTYATVASTYVDYALVESTYPTYRDLYAGPAGSVEDDPSTSWSVLS